MATTVTLKPNAIDLSGSTSGTTTLQASAVAGTTTITLPAATDTLVGKATTDTLTNKTLTSPVLVTPELGTPASGVVTNLTGTASININGTVGATTPSSGAFTTLSSTGNTTLGDATTDTVTVNGYMGVGGAGNANSGLRITSSALTGGNQYGALINPVGSSAATASVNGLIVAGSTAASAFTCTSLFGLIVADATKGAGSTITNQFGIRVEDQTQGTNNYGVQSQVSSGTNKWNIYASGTALNYFAGNVGIGTTAPAGLLQVQSNLAGNNQILLTNIASSNSGAGSEIVFTQGASGYAAGKIQCDREGSYSATASSQDSALVFFTAADGVDAEQLRITSAGNVLVTGAGGLGYGAGSGGAVTQLTSRTTGVTLNKTNGAITMFSAAGSATAATFTVTNSTVAATDVIHLSQKSGTNLYVLLVTAVAAGSFNVTFYTTGGTATDAPVLNFAITKAVVA